MGEPDDVAGECNARAFVADNYGDNHTTFRCQLPAGHTDLMHEEVWGAEVNLKRMQWRKDERASCHACGALVSDSGTYCGSCRMKITVEDFD